MQSPHSRGKSNYFLYALQGRFYETIRCHTKTIIIDDIVQTCFDANMIRVDEM